MNVKGNIKNKIVKGAYKEMKITNKVGAGDNVGAGAGVEAGSVSGADEEQIRSLLNKNIYISKEHFMSCARCNVDFASVSIMFDMNVYELNQAANYWFPEYGGHVKAKTIYGILRSQGNHEARKNLYDFASAGVPVAMAIVAKEEGIGEGKGSGGDGSGIKVVVSTGSKDEFKED